MKDFRKVAYEVTVINNIKMTKSWVTNQLIGIHWFKADKKCEKLCDYPWFNWADREPHSTRLWIQRILLLLSETVEPMLSIGILHSKRPFTHLCDWLSQSGILSYVILYPNLMSSKSTWSSFTSYHRKSAKHSLNSEKLNTPYCKYLQSMIVIHNERL